MKNRHFFRKMGLFALLAGFAACGPTAPLPSASEQAEDFRACQNKLSEVIMFDIFTPPVAARIYAHAHLAALVAMGEKGATMASNVRDFTPPPTAKGVTEPTLAGLRAFLNVARGMTFSTQILDEFEKSLFQKYEKALPRDAFKNSMAHGEAVAAHVLNHSKSDNYAKTRGLRFTLKKQPGAWQPTPPAYADAVEPNWGAIRPFALDSAGQFAAAQPSAFSMQKGSAFRREVEEVVSISKKMSDEQRRIAWFWDDNAFVFEAAGHSAMASKKLTPGGHWLMIAQRFSREKGQTAGESAEVGFLVSAAIFDGFVACWKIKFETDRVRPETVIQAEIDKNWQPFLQTPPFPEFPSGHSTISAASAEVLTAFFGENAAFVDSTELVFGHGIGRFSSLRAAANEASESRLFGGIHFRSGCESGAALGQQVGQFIVKKLKNNQK